MEAPTQRGRRCFCLAKARDPSGHPYATAGAVEGDPEIPVHLRGLRLSELKAKADAVGVASAALDEAIDSPQPNVAVVALIVQRQSQAQADDRATTEKLEGLTLLKPTALYSRALSAGADHAAANAALDSDTPKAALASLVVEHEARREKDASEARRDVRAGLSAMKLSELLKQAKDGGVAPAQIESALGGKTPKAALIDLLVEHATSADTGANLQTRKLHGELQAMKLGALYQHALSRGIPEAQVDSVMDDDHPKESLVALLVAMPSPKTDTLHVDTPHFGGGMVEKTAKRDAGFLPNKHVMLSYEWSDQKKVIRVNDMLTQSGVKCWMDITGGMGADIYDSMAEGVSNSYAMVCFMSQKYQQSQNCMLEAKYAKQCGVEIIPVMMESDGWRATGWLGLLTAGALWTSMTDESDFEENVRQLHGQIQKQAGAVMSEDVAEEAVASPNEAKEELDRLRDMLQQKDERTEGLWPLADPSHPAAIPAGVPKLPAKFQTTQQIQELTRLVLSTSTADMSRVGFWGMGGIGKTVTGAAIARTDAVRLHFHVIIWLPLGQSPVLAKLQNLCHMQCTGKALSSELSSEEKKEALQQALKGKRVLLCLDDLWEEQHESELNLVDESAGSKVLISTRVRGLLEGGHQVEVGLPSPSDSVRMLLVAADADTSDGRQPRGVDEVVDLCGRLPLALGIAGRLAASLGLVGTADWSDMCGVLKEELRESHSGGTEEGMIRASLRGLKGSAQEQANVRSLLLMFALTPEDTHCPLEVMLLMFNAVHKGANASMMHIRKWLRILLNRSLVLGTVDRPSVHDLVLDFAVAQHSDDTLRQNHRAVVETFRASRPTDVYGRRKYEPTRVDDPLSMYVCQEVKYHVSNSRGHGEDDSTIIEWLADVPQDIIVTATAEVIGPDRLSELAASAETSRDWWLAARYWLSVQLINANAIQAEVGPTVRAIEAFENLGTIAPSEPDKEDFQVQLVGTLATAWDMTGDLAKRPDLVQHVLSTKAALRAPMQVGTIRVACQCLPPLIFGPDIEEVGRQTLDTTLFLLGAAESDPDPSTRSKCLIMAFNFTQLAPCMWMHLRTSAQWDQVYGVGGATITAAFDKYNYDVHHHLLNTALAGDWFIGFAAPSLPLLIHYGDVASGVENMRKAVVSIRRMVDDSDNVTEQSLLINALAVWPILVWSCRLSVDQREVMASMMHDAGMTFSRAEATIEPMSKILGWMSELGDKNSAKKSFHTAENVCIRIKCNHILMSGELRASDDEIMHDLPSVEDIARTSVSEPGKGANCMFHTSHALTNSFLSCAYVCEKLGNREEALKYALAGQSDDFTRAGTTLPLTRVLLQSVQARSLAALGRQSEAGPVFEAVAEECHQYGLHLYAAFALRDLKICVLDEMGHGDHGSRRLGAVLRRLAGPAELLTPLLDGLDAAEMMAMPEPDPSNSVMYYSGPENLAIDGLRQELQGLRLMALYQRCTEVEAVDAAELEATMESDNPKAALVSLLLRLEAPQ